MNDLLGDINVPYVACTFLLLLEKNSPSYTIADHKEQVHNTSIQMLCNHCIAAMLNSANKNHKAV